MASSRLVHGPKNIPAVRIAERYLTAPQGGTRCRTLRRPTAAVNGGILRTLTDSRQFISPDDEPEFNQ